MAFVVTMNTGNVMNIYKRLEASRRSESSVERPVLRAKMIESIFHFRLYNWACVYIIFRYNNKLRWELTIFPVCAELKNNESSDNIC